jgi:DNA-nicking Smr family endonuclease
MRRPRALSEADRAIWARVAGTARPLSRGEAANAPKLSTPPAAEASSVHRPAAGPPLAWPTQPARRRLVPAGRPEPFTAWSPGMQDRPGPVTRGTPGLDGGTAQRLARGKRAPQARLDLHGMTADRAHAALSRFIIESAQAGLRLVLVVTGMGRGEDGRRRGDGVLRRETPRWLGVAPLSGHIVGVYEAHPRHGGAGALYVYLKRGRRRGSGHPGGDRS